jgi:hypothetical protein
MAITRPVSWAQALSWRMGRHLLDPVGQEAVAGVVRRLGAVPAVDTGLAELAIRTRQRASRPGEVGEALERGDIIRTTAFRGAVHYLSGEDGGAYLALRAAGRQWELPSWRTYYGLEPAQWPAFRAAVREAVAGGPLSVRELGEAVTRRPAYRHLRAVFDDGAGTLLKPLMWQGDLCFGPARDGRGTVQRLDDKPSWGGIWELDQAGPHAIVSYLRAYGPATPDHVHHWLGEGLSAGRKRLTAWLDALASRLAPVDVDGDTAYVLAEDVDELVVARPTDAVRLLPGFDQWVVGPGTKDEHVVPAARRAIVTRKAHLVVAGGVVSGTWSTAGDEVSVTWFAERGRAPRAALEDQVARLAELLGRSLTCRVETG